MTIEDPNQNRLAHRARTAALALALPLMLLCLAGCGDVRGEANGAADDRGAIQHIRIGWPF